MDPFLGEIRLFGGNFAPRGWMLCQGQVLSIAQNTALFSLLGTTYGGNGQTTFALPDLRGRVPVHAGQGPGLPEVDLGEVSGVEQVSLIVSQMPAHAHTLPASSLASITGVPTGNVVADTTVAALPIYAGGGPSAPMDSTAMDPAGGSQPHENRMPFMAMNFIIAVEGIFPSRN
jgi:microcystin-dependent protein